MKFGPLRFFYLKGERSLMNEPVVWARVPFTSYPIVIRLDLKATNRFWKRERVYTDGTYYYHKDPLHGEVEMYDRRGRHINVLTPEGEDHPKKGQVPGRKISL